jgi:chromosome segregation ATPase
LQESGANDSKHAKEAETARKVVSTLKDKLAAAEAELSDLQQRYRDVCLQLTAQSSELSIANDRLHALETDRSSQKAVLESRVAELETLLETCHAECAQVRSEFAAKVRFDCGYVRPVEVA